MNRTIAILVLISASSFQYGRSAAPAFELYVSASGRESRELGTVDHPFSSIFVAQEKLRNGLGGNSTKIVKISGEHFLPRTFRLDARDSGTKRSPIIYTSAVKDDPGKLSGGLRVPQSAWKKYSSNIYVANLFDLGLNVSDLGGIACPYPKSKLELFYGGKPATLARDPNIAHNGTWMWAGYEDMKVVEGSNTTFYFEDTDRAAMWEKALSEKGSDLWLHGFFKFDWRDTYIKLDSIAKANSTGYFVTRDKHTPPQYPWVNGCRFYAVNSLALLDAPGEYFVSDVTGDLYFYPPGEKGVMLDTAVSLRTNVVVSSGAEHVSWENLVISDARGDVMQLKNATGVTVRNCTVSNAGGKCISLVGTTSSVARSTIFGCGTGGVGIQGGDPQTLEPSNITVTENTIHEFSRIIRTYTPAVEFQGVGHLVSNNTIFNAPHTAIQGGCVNCIFEFNHVSHACFGTVDVGAFYVGRSWAQRGNIVRFNIFDTVRATERLAQKSCSQNAFYLDDEMSGWDVYGNVFSNAAQGVLLGGGRRNHFHSNLFLKNNLDIAFDNRGMNWQSAFCHFNCSASLGTSCARVALQAVHYQSPPWSVEFPELVDIYSNHPCVPVENVIDDNRYCHEHSPPGTGLFLNRDEDVIRSWLSRSSNNVEDCSEMPREYIARMALELLN
jgi:hypothetical protein|eukprot:g3217.t1